MSETFQIPLEAAEFYEAHFVPAFFAQWAPRLCAAASISSGDRVLDVGCGTGIVARTAADLTGPDRVTGLDLNTAMLAVAERARPDLTWRQGDAVALPFPDDSRDVVLSQMALMFIDDRAGALREMARVAAPGSRVGILVPSELDQQEMFTRFIEVAARHAGAEAVPLLSSYFTAGSLDDLCGLFENAGLHVTKRHREIGHYGAPSVDAAVANEVESTPLRDRLDNEAYARIRADARLALAPYTASDGSLDAPFAVSLVVGTVV